MLKVEIPQASKAILPPRHETISMYETAPRRCVNTVAPRGLTPHRLDRKGLSAMLGAQQNCSIPECDRGATRRGWCQLHYQRWKRTGDPVGVLPMGRRRASDASYNAVHLRLKFDRGPARNHACVDCGEPAQAWSYNHADPDALFDAHGRPYSLDQSNYAARCWPCHNPVDRAAKAARGAA